MSDPNVKTDPIKPDPPKPPVPAVQAAPVQPPTVPPKPPVAIATPEPPQKPNGVHDGILTVAGVDYDLSKYGELSFSRRENGGGVTTKLRQFTGTGGGEPVDLPITSQHEAGMLQDAANAWWREHGRG